LHARELADRVLDVTRLDALAARLLGEGDRVEVDRHVPLVADATTRLPLIFFPATAPITIMLLTA
jgi:hypothetical protein